MAGSFIILLCFYVTLHWQGQVHSHELSPISWQQFKKNLDFNFYFNTNISNDLCNNHLAAYQDDLERNVLWARKIRDSWGKVPSGLFSGNYFDLGNFDQCIDVDHISNEIGEIAGQHCTLMIPYDLEVDPETKLATPSRSKDAASWARCLKDASKMQEMRAGMTVQWNMYQRLTRRTDVVLRIGICVPQSCSPDEVRKFSEQALVENFNLTLESSYDQETVCSTRNRSLTYASNGVRVFAITFFVVMLVVVITSTTYEVVCNIMEVKVNPMLNAFSVYTNSKVIMTMKPLMPKEIMFLHGIRSLAIIWIVWGHAFSIDFWMAPLMNAKGLLDQSGHPVAMIMFSGYLGVDTFLMLSSMLMTLSVFRELDKTRKINIPVLFVKRYLRITVPLAAAILFNVGIYMHLSDGPFWKLIGGKLTEFCVDGWWTTLIYLANYIRPGKLCFGHSWYLMVDMQLYFLSPLVLYPIWRLKERVAYTILLIFGVASSSVVYIIVMYMQNDFRASLMSETGSLKEVLIYTTAIGRLGAWMMGILVAYLLHLCESRNTKICTKLVTLGWIATAGLIATIIFIQYPLRQENYLNNPLIGDALYDALRPICWGLVIGWTILACHLSHDNVVKRFLSLSLWIPISKLSFCIYLMHLPVQAYFLATLRSPVYFTVPNGLYHFYGNFVTSFFLAFIWALMFEYPTLKIIAILLSKRRYRQREKNSSAEEAPSNQNSS